MHYTLVRRWLYTTLATAAILILSLAPIPDNPPLGDVPFIDKWVHFVMYGALVSAAWLDRKTAQPQNRKAKRPQNHITAKLQNRITFALLALLYAIAIGALTEVLQSLTPYRNGDWIDFLADCFGSLLATLLCLPLTLWTESKEKR